MVGWIAQGRINHEIKFKICDIISLHSKERWIIMISTGLQEVEPVYNKEQDATALNWRSDWQVKICQVL